MTSENTTTLDTSLDDLLNRHFPGKVVRKDLTKLVKEGANVPVYVLEYLLGNYCASNDETVIEDGLRTVKKVLAENYVRPDEAEKVKSTIREKGSLKIIDKATVTLNEKRDVYEALLANLGVKGIEVNSSYVKKFESSSGNLDERKKWVNLVLKDRQYSKKTPYRLVLRDAETGVEQQGVEVVIDRAFTDDF